MDLTGQRYGFLVVLARSDRDATTQGDAYWVCQCDCGTVKDVAGRHLRSGRIVACGCHRGRNPTHGHKPVSGASQEYDAWCNMKARCLRRSHKRYKDWGGRGITVCKRWLHDFAAFYADMGPKPSPQHQLDRKHNDGPYSPDNCRWATVTEQRHNTRQRVIAHGATHHNAKLTDAAIRKIRHLARLGVMQKHIAKRFGIHRSTVLRVVALSGWKHVQ